MLEEKKAKFPDVDVDHKKIRECNFLISSNSSSSEEMEEEKNEKKEKVSFLDSERIKELGKEIQSLTSAAANLNERIRQTKKEGEIHLSEQQRELETLLNQHRIRIATLSPTLHEITALYQESLQRHTKEASNLFNSFVSLITQLTQTLTSESSAYSKINRIYQQYDQTKIERKNLNLALAVGNELQLIFQQLKELQLSTSQSNYSNSAQLLLSVEEKLIQLHKWEGMPESQVYARLKTSISSGRDELLQLVRHSLFDSVVLKHLSYNKTGESLPLSISSAVYIGSLNSKLTASSFECFDSLSRYEVAIEEVVGRFVEFILTPLFHFASTKSLLHRYSFIIRTPTKVEEPLLSSSTSIALSSRLFILYLSGRDGCQSGDFPSLLASLIEFFLSSVLHKSSALTSVAYQQLVGKHLWPPLASLLNDFLLLPSTPTNVNELRSYGVLATSIDSLQQYLTANNLIVLPTFPTATSISISSRLLTSTTPLTDYTSNILHHFTQSIRFTLLDRVRDLLINSAYDVWNETAGVGHKILQEYPSIFFPSSVPGASMSITTGSPPATPLSPSSPVSSLTLHHSSSFHSRITASFLQSNPCKFSTHMYAIGSTLIECAYQAIEAITLSPSITARLIECIKDSVQLVLGIPGVYSGSQLESVPVMSLLFVNDCLYLIHVLTHTQSLLSLHLKSFLSSPTETLPSSSLLIIDLIPPLQTLSTHWYRHCISHQRESLLQSLHSLSFATIDSGSSSMNQVTQTLKGVLHELMSQYRVWSVVMSVSTVSLVFGCLCEMIGARVVEEIFRVEDMSVDAANRIYQCIDLITQPQFNCLIHPVYTPSWPRLRAIAVFIRHDQSLVSLMGLYGEGHFHVLQTEELVRLIRAVYERSSLREKFVSLVEKSE